MEIRVTGAHQLAAVSRALKQHGDKALVSEMTKGITKVVKPTKKRMKANAVSSLPSRGGLGKRVSKSRISHRTRRGALTAGVRIDVHPSAVADPKRIDRGRVLHPIWGEPPMVPQDVTPGWASKPFDESAPVVRKELIQVMNETVSKIARSV